MTGSDSYGRIKQLFLESCSLPAEERADFLDRACDGDLDLRREVETMLALDREPEAGEASREPLREVGPYRLLQKIGEGGMGEVWEAEQKRPVRRRVALKLIKWGMDTKEVLARFESERQALALMNHPNIARAYDAGSTLGGRPFFAMEFVAGVPLNEYCDAQRLSTRERLEIFVKVCDGVQHAHQKGVIHRDIKPSNILVAIEDGKPVPKIIDFGVAKATSQRLTEQTLFTELGQWIGTPEYMSPEQAELTSLDIDTRSDVYSLGVVLYELLAGSQPFDPRELRTAGFDEMRRRIREDEPPRPSTRVSSLGGGSDEAARRRRTDSRGLVRTLRGDLDWIVLKAMEKDRTRRYGSPSELGADIGRYLRSEPVGASQPSAFYRVGKFIRRHRVGVASGVLLFVTLVAGIIGTTLGLVRARREAAAAQTVSELLAGVFADIDPGGRMGGLTAPAMILDRGAERIEQELVDQPELQAGILRILGDAYRGLGRYGEARQALESSLRLRREVLEPTDPAIVTSQVSLGVLEFWTGNYHQSLELFEGAAAAYDQLLGRDDPTSASTLALVGITQARIGMHEAARSSFEQALEVYRTIRPDDPRIAMILHSYSVLLMDLGDWEAARPMIERAIELQQEAFGPDHTEVGWMTLQLGRSYLETLRYDESQPFFERALEIQQRALGPDHLSVAPPLISLAIIDRVRERRPEGRVRLERAIEITERFQGPDHPDLVFALVPYSRALQDSGEFDRSFEAVERAVRIAETTFGEIHLDTARALEGMGYHYYRLRDFGEAGKHYLRALSIRQRLYGPDHPALGWNLYDLACIQALAGDRPAALDTLRQALDAGWTNQRLFEDSDLDTLRDDPEFAAIADEVRERL